MDTVAVEPLAALVLASTIDGATTAVITRSVPNLRNLCCNISSAFEVLRWVRSRQMYFRSVRPTTTLRVKLGP